MDWKPNTRGFVVPAAIVLLIACGAGDDPPARAADAGEELATPAEGPTSAAQQSPTAWRVDLVVDQPEDATSNAWSPVASAPEALADANGDFSSSIRYMCFSGRDRRISLRSQTVSIQFQAVPRPVMMEGRQEGERGPIPLGVRTTWGEEEVALQAYVVRSAILFDQTDAADRATGESSNVEFLRRLLRGGSTEDDAVVIELDWEEVGPVRYTFSLEGAADAIREAGRPCGVG